MTYGCRPWNHFVRGRVPSPLAIDDDRQLATESRRVDWLEVLLHHGRELGAERAAHSLLDRHLAAVFEHARRLGKRGADGRALDAAGGRSGGAGSLEQVERALLNRVAFF